MLTDSVNGPAVAWTESLNRLYGLMRKVNEVGGMARVSKGWDSATKALFAGELARIIAILTAWERELSHEPPNA